MALVTPTAESAPTYPAQAVIDATDLGALAAGLQGTGVASGCQVSPFATPGYAVQTAAGSILVQGCMVHVAAATDVVPATASTNDRRDIVVASSAGTVSTVTGTPCSVAGWTATTTSNPPVKPALPAGSVLLGEVYIPGGGGNLTATNIVDKTTVMAPTSGFAVGDFWAAPLSTGTGADSSAFDAGQLYAVQLRVPAGSPSLKSLSMGFEAGGSTVLLGVYSDNADYPGTLLTSTSISPGSYTANTGDVSPVLAGPWPQTLWFVCVCPSGTMPTFFGASYQNVLPTNGNGAPNNNNASWAAVIIVAGPYATLPAVFPAGGTVTVAEGAGAAAPWIWGGF